MVPVSYRRIPLYSTLNGWVTWILKGARSWPLFSQHHERKDQSEKTNRLRYTTTAAAMKPVDMYLGEHYDTTLIGTPCSGRFIGTPHSGALLRIPPFSLVHFFWIPCHSPLQLGQRRRMGSGSLSHPGGPRDGESKPAALDRRYFTDRTDPPRTLVTAIPRVRLQRTCGPASRCRCRSCSPPCSWRCFTRLPAWSARRSSVKSPPLHSSTMTTTTATHSRLPPPPPPHTRPNPTYTPMLAPQSSSTR